VQDGITPPKEIIVSVTSDRPAQMSVEEFEELEEHAPETVKLEFVEGKLEVKPVLDGAHGEIVMWLLEQCMQQCPDLRLYPEQGLITEEYGNGRSRPDGALAPKGYFLPYGEWADASGVLMAVEVTSSQPWNDREAKPNGYAGAGIPVYLLIDRGKHEVVVYSRPEKGEYRDIHRTVGLGEKVELPKPVSITLDTEKLKDFMS
jgi:Uma2 family endonuclease